MTQAEPNTESRPDGAHSASVPAQEKVVQDEAKEVPVGKVPELVPGSREAVYLRTEAHAAAQKEFDRIMKLISKWRAASVGAVPVEMVKQAMKAVCIYQGECNRMLNEYRVQLDRDLYLSSRMLQERMEWEKQHYAIMQIMEERVYSRSIREADEKIAEEKMKAEKMKEEMMLKEMNEMKIKDEKA